MATAFQPGQTNFATLRVSRDTEVVYFHRGSSDGADEIIHVPQDVWEHYRRCRDLFLNASEELRRKRVHRETLELQAKR